jgi:hypothetical protein
MPQHLAAFSYPQNSRIAILKSHAAFMSQPVFMQYVKFFMYMQATRTKF